MNTKHETLLVVSLTAAIFFGSVTGGIAGAVVSHTTNVIGKIGEHVAGAFDAQTGLAVLKAEEEATIQVVHSLAPSVVSVLIEQPDDQGGFYEVGGGTGFFVTTDGMILTNRHVVSEDAHFVVVTDDGAEHVATVLAKDLLLDLAVLKIDGTGYPAVTLGDSKDIRIGETVIAIGNTLSEFRNTVTKGIISGQHRTIIAGSYNSADQEVIEQAIQTDAAISEGNSGGPLINLNGEVIGVNTAVATDGQSLGFAIPIDEAKTVVNDVVKYGRIIRPWLGVHYTMIDREVKKQYDLTVDQGAYVLPNSPGTASIVKGSPAEQAGILADDIILSVNGVALDADHSLADVIRGFAPDDVVALVILRAGLQQTIPVTLQEVDPTKL